MPFRPGVDDNEALKALVAVWRDGEADLLARQAQIWGSIQAELGRGNPDLIRVERLRLAAGRLDELGRVAEAVADDLVNETKTWIDRGGMVDVYGAGVGRVMPFSYTVPHQAAVDVLAQDMFDDVLKLTEHVDVESKAWVRRIGRELTGFKLTGGQAVKAQARRFEQELRREFTSRGITAVTYRDGSRHGFGEYAEMLIRTKCLPPWAPVDSARVLGVTRHWHEGPWVTVRTASGREFSGTPNHPVLTVAGWKGLGELTEGDKLVRNAGDVERCGPAADVDMSGRQATIVEVFDALHDSGHVERAPAVQVDFHGDRPDQDVDVVRADGVLLVGGFAPVSERSGYVGLESADLGRVAVDAFRYRFTHGDGVNGCHCLAAGPVPSSGLVEDAADDSDCAAVLAGEIASRSSRLVLSGDGGVWQIEGPGVAGGSEPGSGGVASGSCEAGPADDVRDGGGVHAAFPSYDRAPLPAAVGVDDVESVTFGEWSGHVYNLHTLDGYWWSDGMATGNTAIAYNTGTLNQARGLGIEWYEILDGAECGLAFHYDPEKANGLIVRAEIAVAFPLSHANCRRSINPRPDIRRGDLGESERDRPRSVQSDESRADQRAWEAYLRAEQASRGSRRPLTGSGGGGGGLTGRTATGPVAGQPAALTGPRVAPSLTRAQLQAKADRLRRREYVQRTRAQAQAARELEELEQSRAAARAAGFRGEVDPEVLQRWGVTERQWLNARAIVNDVRADVRASAKAQADELGSWLFNNDLADLTRPARLVRRTDVATGRTRFARTQSGYDWLEQLDEPSAARIRKRMVESDLYTPDVLAGVVRQKTNLDLTDDEAMEWLVDRWLQEDGLRSVASGRIPKYAEPNNLLPAEQALEGYRLDRLLGVDVDDAAGHIASVQSQAAAREAAQVLGSPVRGPAPWEMEFSDYLRDLEQVEDILGRTQLAPGIDPGEAFAYARERIQELAPPGIDPDGSLNPVELFERIRLTAQSAGLPTSGG